MSRWPAMAMMLALSLITAPAMAAAPATESTPAIGIGLFVLGLLLIVVEALTPTVGFIGALGVVAFMVGAVMLFDAGWLPGSDSWWGLALVALVALIIGAFLLWVVLRVAKLRRVRPQGGQEGLFQARGEALESFRVRDRNDYRGHVRLHGERWQARASSPIQQGEAIRATALDGLRLTVTPVDDSNDPTTAAADKPAAE